MTPKEKAAVVEEALYLVHHAAWGPEGAIASCRSTRGKVQEGPGWSQVTCRSCVEVVLGILASLDLAPPQPGSPMHQAAVRVGLAQPSRPSGKE